MGKDKGNLKNLSFLSKNNEGVKMDDKAFFMTSYEGVIEKSDKGISLRSLLDVEKIQGLQDSFAVSMGVPLILLDPEGRQITEQSGEKRIFIGDEAYFARLRHHAFLSGKKSIVFLLSYNDEKFFDGGVLILCQGKIVGLWLVGQVCCKEQEQNPESLIFEKIDSGNDDVNNIPVMNFKKFSDVCKSLEIVSKLLSEMAITNLRQGRLIKENIESENKYQEILERVSDWIYLHDLDGNLYDSNLHFTNKLGYSKQFLKKINIRELISEKNIPGFNKYLERIIEHGEDSGTMEINSKTGEPFVVEYNNVLVTLDDGKQYVQGSARDITTRVNAYKEIKNNEEKYKNILATIHEGYYEVDLKGNFTFVNESIAGILGTSVESLIGINNREFMTDVSAKKVFKAYNDAYKSKSSIERIEMEIVRKDGSVRHAETSVNIVYDGKKNILGYRGIVRDITEKRKMEDEIRKTEKKAQNARNVTILGLAKLSEYRDNDAGTHLERMREFSKIIASGLSKKEKYLNYISEAYIEDIYQSAILHDIGKVGIPDYVLRKPGKLTSEEFEIIKTHSILGGDAIKEIESDIEGQSFLTIAREIAYHHHEKWNGKGYPFGLAGESIPLSARIVAIADVYDALTSKRVYKEAFTHFKAVEIIRNERGEQFDPEIVEVFMENENEFEAIRKKMHDD